MIVRHPKMRRTALAGARIGLAASAALFLNSAAAYSSGPGGGKATVKGSTGAAEVLTGTSTTPFTLVLPTGAACPGDSAADGYRVQTYMVPVSVDIFSLTFGSNGPLPAGLGAEFRQPLFSTQSSPYVNKQTTNADTPGGPGFIVNIPEFSFAVFGPGDLPAGRYSLGVACSLGPASATQLKSVWNAEMDITVAAVTADNPAGITWSGAPQTTPTSPGATTTTVGGSTTTSLGTTTTTLGATTTTTGATTTTTDGATTTTTADAGATTTIQGGGSSTGGVSSGQLSRTGGLSASLVVWSLLLLIFGRMVVLFSRKPQVRTGVGK